MFVHTAGPNVALIKTSGKQPPKVVIGGNMFALPVFHRVDRLSLHLRTILVKTRKGITAGGVQVNVDCVCQIKIRGWATAGDATASPSMQSATALLGSDIEDDEGALQLAAQHFLFKTDAQIENMVGSTLAGYQRSIISLLTVEELYRDRAAFSRRVVQVASRDMRNMGLTILSYTVSSLTDDNGYLESLSVTQLEAVQREAVEGRAHHRAAARAKTAQDEAASYLIRNQRKQQNIVSDMQSSVANYQAQTEIAKQKAVQDKAHAISSAEQDSRLFITRQQAREARARAEINVVRQEVLSERLHTQRRVHVECDANLYKAKVNADGVRASAAAKADRIRLLAAAKADTARKKGMAQVEILRERNKAWEES